MGLLAIALITGLSGLFIGSQVDNAVESKFTPVGGGVKRQSLPLEIKIPLLIAGGTAAFFVTKKLIKKL